MHLAHVFIGRYELLVPLYTVLTGAVAVVAASFGLIYLLPPRRREAVEGPGAAVPRAAVWLLQSVAVLYVAFVIVVGTVGRQTAVLNGATVLFWVITIPVLPIAHCVVGGMYEVANPFALGARLLSSGRSARASRTEVLDRLGYWPAVVLMFLLFWFELAFRVVPNSPRVFALIVVGYTLFQVAMGLALGEDWYRGGDLIQAITTLASRIAPLELFRDGRGWVRLRTGFQADRPLRVAPGREALITLWLAGVLADGVLKTPVWTAIQGTTKGLVEGFGQIGQVDLGDLTLDTGEIVFTWIAFAVFFWTFTYAAASLSQRRPRDVAKVVAPSLIPIALAYLLAHNLGQVIVYGPLLISASSADVAQVGALVASTTRLISPGLVWWTQVAAIVVGHVLAVIMAHARLALVERDETLALRADLGWLAAMLVYTATSLWVLAQPATSGG